MTQKKGLGSGLNALFGNFDDMNVEDAEKLVSYKEDGSLMRGVTEISLEMIAPDPEQPRKHFDEIALRELASSIRQHGVLQPILVSVSNSKWSIIAGERRFRAAQMAGLEKIPAIIRHFSSRQRREISLIENLQREDLNPIEEARGIQTLINQYGATQEEVAAALGKSRPAVTNMLRLLTLEPEIIEMLSSGKLMSAHGRLLASVKDSETQLAYANAACDKKMSVRELELMVNAHVNPSKRGKTPERPPITAELKELVNDMQRIFATKVKAVGNHEKGRIYIDYYTMDDLDRIFDIMKSIKVTVTVNEDKRVKKP